jgi:hypothetical protein
MYTYKNRWKTNQHDDEDPPETELNGDLVFYDDDDHKNYFEAGSFLFFAGPQTKGGNLSDIYKVDEEISKILPFVETGVAENMHEAEVKKYAEHFQVDPTRVTYDVVKAKIKELLLAAGFIIAP